MRAAQAARTKLRGKHVKIFSDNFTAVAYVNKQGGTKNEALMGLTYSIFSLAERNFLLISAVHIKGKENVMADFLSRHTLIQTEWSMNRENFGMISDLWGVPEMDLFATRQNRQVSSFWSLDPQEGPWAVDALTIRWEWDLAYAFPRLPLIPRVLSKIREDRAKVILIAPFWPKRAWYSLLWSMSLRSRPMVIDGQGERVTLRSDKPSSGEGVTSYGMDFEILRRGVRDYHITKKQKTCSI